MVITPHGYTKHYYAGSERVATAIGNGRWISEYPYTLPEGSHDNYIVSHTLSPLLDPYPLGNASFDTLAFNVDINNQLCVNLKYCADPFTLERIKLEGVKSLQETMTHYAENQSGSEPMYYYHGDHLGSASWITEQSGKPIQYIHYLPYGEILANQTPYGYDERFKFIDKERDEESGYDYFGERYFYSTFSHWLSVDPMSDTYPNISPYAYCGWNPIKYIDPDGNKIVVGSWFGRALAKLGINNYEAKVMSHLNELKGMDPELNKMITKIEEPDTEYHIINIDGNKFSYNDSEKEIRYNPDSKETKSGKKRPAQVGLAHELGHAENDVEGTTIRYDEEKARQGNQVELDKWNKNELNSIDKENIVRENYNCKERPYNYFINE